MGTFRDDEYYEKIVGCKEEAIQEKINEADKIKTASERASNIRIFETGLFWNRGTYYWAFILAAYTALFSLLSLLLNAKSTDEISQQEFFTLESFLSFSNFGLFCLTATAFICFLFCLSWVLMNKGSRFWQKNWEEHVYKLEKVENIRLFATYLNPEFKDYKKCLFPFRLMTFQYQKSLLQHQFYY